MSEEWIAGLITVAVIAGLVACVPCLHGLSRGVSALIRASDEQSNRYPWGRGQSHSGRSEESKERKVFRPR